MLVPHNSYTNLTSAAGLGLIGFKKEDVVVDYGCMFFDSYVYASRQCKKIVGIVPSSEKFKTLQKRLVEEDVKNCDLVNANFNEQHIEGKCDCIV